MPKRKADLSPEHFSWLVEGRSANQRSALELYKLMHSAEPRLNASAELQNAAQELTAITFSLWRAVFLSDTTGEYADQLADVKDFLVSLISDNTVLYITDKNARNWSFRYYVDNARHRLRGLSGGGLDLVDEAELSKPAETDKDDWKDAQDLLDEAIKRFGLWIDPPIPAGPSI